MVNSGVVAAIHLLGVRCDPCGAMQRRSQVITALFSVITQRLVLISWTFRDNLSVPYSELNNPEDETDRLSRNVGKKLPLHAA